jgi:hypothetical protein
MYSSIPSVKHHIFYHQEICISFQIHIKRQPVPMFFPLKIKIRGNLPPAELPCNITIHHLKLSVHFMFIDKELQ